MVLALLFIHEAVNTSMLNKVGINNTNLRIGLKKIRFKHIYLLLDN